MGPEASPTLGRAGAALQLNDVGPYAEISRRPNPRSLVIVFMPSLVATLLRAEAKKGGGLTADEVLRIRDACNVFVTVPPAARAVEQRRGYPDLDPEEPYEGWLRRGRRV